MIKNNHFLYKNKNATKYGEFICSFDNWLPPEYQKENAQRLENITKK